MGLLSVEPSSVHNITAQDTFLWVAKPAESTFTCDDCTLLLDMLGSNNTSNEFDGPTNPVRNCRGSPNGVSRCLQNELR